MHPQVFITFSLLILTTNQLVGHSNGAVINKMCIDEERHALLDFKARVQDPNDALSTWRTTNQEEDDCCRWRGVTCDDTTGHVTQLQLYHLLDGGELSPLLSNLSYLNHLDLSDNYISGTIPTSIGLLTQLSHLNLAFNSFYGIIPPEIGNLTNLQSFSLGCLERSCVIENIDWLTNLSHLQELSMVGVIIAKANHWVDVFQSLKRLSFLSLLRGDLSQVMYPAYSSSPANSSPSSSITTLELVNNKLNSSMYHWLFPLTSPSLSSLDLSENMLDEIPTYIGNLCGLTSLKFYGNSASINFGDMLRNLSSGCTSDTLEYVLAPSSHLTGPFSDEIQRYSSLMYLHLDDNHLNGTLSEKLWELPMLEFFDVSSNFLGGAISENIGKTKILRLNLSNNSLLQGVSTDHMLNLSYAEYIDLSSCKLGPQFPKWMLKLKNLTRLDIASNGISDAVPPEFWDTWPSQLRYLNLSSNNITTQVPDLLSNFENRSIIDLSSNNLYGPILNVSSVTLLNLSGNKLSGGIFFLCQILDGFLEFLDLSNNLFSGQVPDCLSNFRELKVLNLGHNNLFGRLPASIESLIKLEVLYLYKNEFSGELPSSLKNCTNLQFLNLGANNFSGNVPVWIGESLSGLYVLSLRSNNFFDTIPLQLCQLVDLQLLDLSNNNLSGTIPSCLNNLTTMVQEGFVATQTVHSFAIPWWGSRSAHPEYIYDDYIDHATIEWQGNVHEFANINLGLLRIIDLSSNNLTGQLPFQITSLHGLIALNLSNNALRGDIPWNIGEMKKLLTLDVSRNNFSGGIPSSMTQMTSLNYLDVSYNSLSGRIPSSTQLQSFDPSRYNGNEGLCGPPVTKSCIGDDKSPTKVTIGESGSEDTDDELQRWFYIGGGVGFATGFWIACGTLVLNQYLRHAFFHNLNSFKDWVYVKVMLFIAK